MDILTLVDKAGAATVLLYVVWAFLTEKLVTGKALARERKEKDEYKALAFDYLNLAHKGAELADRARRRQP